MTAWVIRFANNVKKNNEKFRGGLVTADLDPAGQYWIKQVQKDEFHTWHHVMPAEHDKHYFKARRVPHLSDDNGIFMFGGRLKCLLKIWM